MQTFNRTVIINGVVISLDPPAGESYDGIRMYDAD